MFEQLKLETNDEYFLPVSSRSKAGVYFCRYIGYDDDIAAFLGRFLEKAQACGAYINKGLGNPNETQVKAFYQVVDPAGFSVDPSWISHSVIKWFEVGQKQSRLFSDAVCEMLGSLRRQGVNDNILKNTYVKFMCWGKQRFLQAIGALGGTHPPKILYEGDISKYELYMLRVLSLAGCDVVYLHFLSEDAYLKIDGDSAYSSPVYGKSKGVPKQHFSAPKPVGQTPVKQAAMQQRKVQATGINEMLATNTWVTEGILDGVFRTREGRGPSSQMIYNLYGRYIGVDEQSAYMARIYTWKEKLLQSGRTVVLQTERIANPELDEVKTIKPIQYREKEELIAKLSEKISYPGNENEQAQSSARSALASTLQRSGDDTLTKLYNHGMKLLCWLNRWGKTLFSGDDKGHYPIFVYYGVPSDSEAEFLDMLSLTPVDVVVISPDYSAAEPFGRSGDRGMEERLENSMPVFPFPQKEPKLYASTAAYQAQQELDTILYSDTGLFRNRQFTRCNPVTLRTTYDEIELLWREEAKYRPSFNAELGRVVVPNLFAKVCGSGAGSPYAYFANIERYLTEKTILIRKVPYITPSTPNPIRSQVHKFIKDGTILPDIIKRDSKYQYDYLSEDMQDYILDKIQQLIELNWIKTDTMGVEYPILSTLLNLDKRTLRLIQQFDFTKEIPKVVVVDTDENVPSLEDCIYLLFLNLAGFDILVFTPTGYRNIEKYIPDNLFETYQNGEYVFNLTVPNLKVTQAPNRNGGLLGRLFGKG